MFEPVTITRSSSVTPDVGVSCPNVFVAETIKHPNIAMTALQEDFDSGDTFISDPNGSDGRDYTEFHQALQRQSEMVCSNTECCSEEAMRPFGRSCLKRS